MKTKTKTVKKLGLWFLSFVMVITGTWQFGGVVKAADSNPIPNYQFASKSAINGGTLDNVPSGKTNKFALASDTSQANNNLGKLKFGAFTWFIAGRDGSKTVIMSTKDFFDGLSKFNNTGQPDSKGNTNNFNTGLLYRQLKNYQDPTLGILYNSYGKFTNVEIALMADTYLKFFNQDGDQLAVGDGDDGDYNITPVGLKMYVPDVQKAHDEDATVIYAGGTNNVPIVISSLKNNGIDIGDAYSFWLRSAWYSDGGNKAYACFPAQNYVDGVAVDSGNALIPVTNLDLTNTAFASAVSEVPSNATSSVGGQSVNLDSGNAMTLRFAQNTKITNSLTTPEVGSLSVATKAGASVGINVTTKGSGDRFIVVQTKSGAWTKKVSNGEYVDFDSIKIGGNKIPANTQTKAWIETTDTTNKITTATDALDIPNATTDGKVGVFAINVQTDGHGISSVASEAEEGTKVSLTATPNKGYEVDTWVVVSGGITIASDNTFTMPANDVTVKVTFKKAKYSVTINASTNGSISADKTTGITMGETVTLTATGDSGYQLDTIEVKTSDATVTATQDSDDDEIYTFVMPGENVNVTSTFKKEILSITVLDDGNGSASADKTTCEIGDKVTLTATPNPGYTFDYWQVIKGDITVGSDNTFTMGGNRVRLKAIFKKVTYKITVQIEGGGFVTLNQKTGAMGDKITLNPQGSTYYDFDSWSVISGGITIAADNSFTMPANDVVIKGIFKKTKYTITVQNDGNGSAIASKTIAKVGDTVKLTATANTGFQFGGWVVANGGVVVNLGDTFTMPASDVIIKATFKLKMTPKEAAAPDYMTITRVGPTKLKVKIKGKKTQLSWTKAKNATGYVLYRSVKGKNKYTMFKEFPTTKVRKLTVLNSKTKYSYKVIGVQHCYLFGHKMWQYGTASGAKVPVGNKITLEKIEFLTDIRENIPTPISVKIKQTKTKANLSWSQSKNAIGYRIYRSYTKKKSSFKVFAETIGETNTKITLKQNKKMYYKIVPVNTMKVKSINFWKFGQLTSLV